MKRESAMAAVVPIDLALGGMPGAAAAYLVKGPEPAVVDPGPPEAAPQLRRALEALGVPPAELRHVLVTHAHREHAGAAGILAEGAPNARIHASEVTAAALAEPDVLPSEGVEPGEGGDSSPGGGQDPAVPGDRLRVWRAGDPDPVEGVQPVEASGHDPGHLAVWGPEASVLVAGDALGVVLTPDSPTHPSAPPGEVDLEAWRKTLSTLRGMAPGWVAVGRFGIHDDAAGRVAALEEALDRLEERVTRAVSQGQEANDQARFREQTLKAQGEHLPQARAERFFRHFDPRRDWSPGFRRRTGREFATTPGFTPVPRYLSSTIR